MMKLAIASVLAGSAAAFAPASVGKASSAMNSFTVDNMPGALAPMGFFDPLGFAEKADEKTLKRYREAEVTHGRVAMLAVIGFLVGEAVEGSSFLFDAQITGPAITHFEQVPDGWDALIVTAIGAAEAQRAQIGWVDPADASYDQPGLLRDDYYPGDIGFDPLGLRPEDPEELDIMITKELQNGRLAMLAVIGFLVGEAVEGSSFLFDAQITGPAITHFEQVPDGWDALIVTAIGAAEAQRAQIGWVDPADASYDQPGLLRDDYYPGDIGFDPLGLRPEDPEELDIMITKELQNGRLAMLAAAGFLAQEAVDGLGIIQHFDVAMIEKAIEL